MEDDTEPLTEALTQLKGLTRVMLAKYKAILGDKTKQGQDINLPLFSTFLPSNSRLFLSYRPFAVIATFSTGLVGVEVTSVSWLEQLTVGDLLKMFL